MFGLGSLAVITSFGTIAKFQKSNFKENDIQIEIITTHKISNLSLIPAIILFIELLISEISPILMYYAKFSSFIVHITVINITLRLKKK
jgi:hypothetical protein